MKFAWQFNTLLFCESPEPEDRIWNKRRHEARRKMKFKTLAAAAIAGAMMTAGGSAAQAADYNAGTMAGWDWYVEILAGAGVPIGHDATVGGTPGEYTPDNGFGLAGAVGTYLRDNVRGELWVSWFRGGDGTMTPFGPHSGNVNAIDILGNVYYEFQNWGGSQFTPWVGAGLGIVIFDYDGLGLTGGAFTLEDSDVAFAGALHAGFDYAVSDRVDFTGRYSMAIHGSHDIVASNGVTPISVDSSVEHAFMVGLRMKMGGN
ncbi:MAG: outer membrane beta-barrel protein [Rhodobacteraceae bacterium]|nr:outer membrane beta-barrel protein [Paracoccaceae bacterium]